VTDLCLSVASGLAQLCGVLEPCPCAAVRCRFATSSLKVRSSAMNAQEATKHTD